MTTRECAEAVKPQNVAVVVAGAGARGAYEAGALSVLLPHLKAAGVVPKLFVGTSAGAINAILFAATAQLTAAEQGSAVLDVWRHIHLSDVFRTPLRTVWRTVAQGIGQFVHVPGVRLTSLLDTAPLSATAERVVNWNQLRTNIDACRTALAVVATSGADNRTKVFVDRVGDPPPGPDDDRAIDYLNAKIGRSHVLASAAIPTIFPPVWVPDQPTTSANSGGWYIDGGVRLNAPLKPALALGADAVVIVATHPPLDRAPEVPHAAPAEAPDIDDVLVRVLDAALVDRMVEDIRTLAKVNALVQAGDVQEHSGVAGSKLVPYLAVGPKERGTLGALAGRVFDERTARIGRVTRLVRDPTMQLLGRLLGGDGSRRGDLLSYLFFDPEFMEASIALGRSDAEAVLADAAAHAVPWQLDPLKDSRSAMCRTDPIRETRARA